MLFRGVFFMFEKCAEQKTCPKGVFFVSEGSVGVEGVRGAPNTKNMPRQACFSCSWGAVGRLVVVV